MAWRRNESASGKERAISALCYLTGGIAGIIYIIISRSSSQSDFFRFHFLQSIVLAIISMLLGWAFGQLSVTLAPVAGLILDLLSKIMPPDNAVTAVKVLGLVISASFQAWNLLPIYGLIWAALGKIAEIPFISNVVRQQMR